MLSERQSIRFLYDTTASTEDFGDGKQPFGDMVKGLLEKTKMRARSPPYHCSQNFPFSRFTYSDLPRFNIAMGGCLPLKYKKLEEQANKAKAAGKDIWSSAHLYRYLQDLQTVGAAT